MKRILILFSVCLNLGFLAAAAHHAMSDDPRIPKPRRLLMQALDGMDVSGQQREAMLALEDRIHANMRQWRDEALDIKTDTIEAMTRAEGPDLERLATNRETELDLLRRHGLQTQNIFLEALGILGPDKLRTLGNSMIEAVRKDHRHR
ncbi:hypothetical protein [Desulfocurvus sp. DL9XJH121]